MKKHYMYVTLSFITILLFFIPSVYSKNLVFQADGNLNNLRWTTFVKAYSTSTSSNHESPIVLRKREGGDLWYLTRYISFHLKEGANYNSYKINDSDKLVFFDDSGDNVITGTNFTNYDSLVHEGRVWVINSDPGHDKKEEFYSSWSETERVSNSNEYAVEESSNNNADKWMRVSTFRLGTLETEYVQSRIQDMYKNTPDKLDVTESGGILYAKVRLDNVLSMKGINENISNAYQFYHNTRDDWDIQNYGTDSNGNFVKGRSALNNFDNYLLIPFKEKQKDREIYVTYKVKGDDTSNGIFWNILKDASGNFVDRYQTLKDGTQLKSTGSVTLQNGSKEEYWLEHYTLSEGQKNLQVKYEESLVNSPYSGIQYQYDSVEIRSGDWSNTYSSTTCEVANDDSNAAIYVTFYYTPKVSNKDQYVYIRHINSDTGMVISDLKGSESFSDGFNNDLKPWAVPSGYQSAYSLKADGITNGGIYNKNKVNKGTDITVNGTTYTYDGYKTSSSTSESLAKSNISRARKNNGSGVWVNTSNSTKYTIIEFYYKPKTPPPPGGDGTTVPIPDVELVGRLDFINKDIYERTTNKSFVTNTADYIPASVDDDEWLNPYVDNAYPYIVRAMAYSEKSESETLRPKITLKKRWSYTTTDDEGNTHVHSGISKRVCNYTVNVTHKYYNIDNFRMYKIKNMTVIDRNGSGAGNNWGGYLYKDSNGEQTIGTSSTYEKRFTEPRGKVKQTFDCNYSNMTYTMSGSADSSEEASSDLDSVDATDMVDLEITIKYDNQYMEIDTDKKTDMLDQNEQTYRYILSGDDSFTVDSTRNCNYTKNLKDYMEPEPSNRTSFDDFKIEPNRWKTATVGDNGVRLLSGKVTYEIVNNSKFKIGEDTFTSKDYTYEINSPNKVQVTSDSLKEISKTFNVSNNYADNNNAKKEVRQVNVLTPLRFNRDEDMFGESYKNTVDMSLNGVQTVTIQQGKEFTIKPSMQKGHSSYTSVNYDPNNFVNYYYVVCDFETNGNAPYKPYTVNNGSSITLLPTSVTSENAVSSENNNVYIIAVAKNTPQRVIDRLNVDFGNETSTKITVTSPPIYISGDQNSVNSLDNEDYQSSYPLLNFRRYGAANHVVMRKVNTNIINRIYDFEVTDCTDLSFKNVFRKDADPTKVNEGTKLAYFSGTKFLIVESGAARVTVDRLGLTTPKNILPLGPYKNTDKTYIFAPKLGYRISFDLKTTGYLNYEKLENNRIDDDRYVGIVPRYYYVSKSGEYKENILLYYKENSGKYKQISKYIPLDASNINGKYSISSGGEYNIYFKPNDGYRYLRSINPNAVNNAANPYNTYYMSNKLQKINISRSTAGSLNCSNTSYIINFPIKLTKEMMTIDDTNQGYIQTWYGEFKLPNSTIAVDQNDANSTINNPLSDGYIGVIFDIYCVDPETNTVLYYGQNDHNVSGENTSQWDYEGYLGFNNPGNSANINLQLEKKSWNINNATYKKIKGTVLLYDIDARAADDFN